MYLTLGACAFALKQVILISGINSNKIFNQCPTQNPLVKHQIHSNILGRRKVPALQISNDSNLKYLTFLSCFLRSLILCFGFCFDSVYLYFKSVRVKKNVLFVCFSLSVRCLKATKIISQTRSHVLSLQNNV